LAASEPETTGTVRSPGDAAEPGAPPALNFTAREDVAAIQVLMDRAGASPGVIDGKFGSNVDKALAAYNELTGQTLKSTDTAGIKAALAASGGDALGIYEITPADAAGPFVASVPADYSEKAKLDHMSFTSVTEMLAERFHMDEKYLMALNPDANFSRPGTRIRVANFGSNVTAKVQNIIADKGRKQVRAYDAAGKLVVAYPATIGSADTPSPTGTHVVSRVAVNPNYTYNPKINFKQGDNDKVLTIPPGPNGPVGSVWIALDKPTYGIHGTPDPSKIGKTESHGCVRLTNWDAQELARLVSSGVIVDFVE
jgi:lipoprotein-anchoring transpeptidase ErfK/SrfK